MPGNLSNLRRINNMDIACLLPESALAVIDSMGTEPSCWKIKQDQNTTTIVFTWGELNTHSNHPQKKHKSKAKQERDYRRQQVYMQKITDQSEKDLTADYPIQPKLGNTSPTIPLSTDNSLAKSVSVECHILGTDKSCQTENQKEANDEKKSLDRNLAIPISSSTLCGNPTKRVCDGVLRRRVQGNRQEYLVRWKDRPKTENSWVPEIDLDTKAKQYIQNNRHKIQGPSLGNRLEPRYIFQPNDQRSKWTSNIYNRR